MNENHQVIHYQIDLLQTHLSHLLKRGTKYALLDFPDHPNVGDSAIWLGELELLKAVTGNAPSFVCTFNNFSFDDLDDALPEGPILLHGGGNFGDIWPWYQEFREEIIKRYPDRSIIQLPQTIHFKSSEILDRSKSIINAHRNFHLFVRDVNSEKFAREHFSCSIKLLPDSAFCIGPLQRPIQPVFDVLLLLRTDAEKGNLDIASVVAMRNIKVVDWLEESQYTRQLSKLRTVFFNCFQFISNKHLMRHYFFKNLANARLNRGLRILSSGKVVVTDRLHAHILSVLLNISHSALDNNYGKISSYIKTWTHSYPKLFNIESTQDEINKAR
jgi:pyruvyl transferase EpsO